MKQSRLGACPTIKDAGEAGECWKIQHIGVIRECSARISAVTPVVSTEAFVVFLSLTK
jgi:hypothetical protein